MCHVSTSTTGVSCVMPQHQQLECQVSCQHHGGENAIRHVGEETVPTYLPTYELPTTRFCHWAGLARRERERVCGRGQGEVMVALWHHRHPNDQYPGGSPSCCSSHPTVVPTDPLSLPTPPASPLVPTDNPCLTPVPTTFSPPLLPPPPVRSTRTGSFSRNLSRHGEGSGEGCLQTRVPNLITRTMQSLGLPVSQPPTPPHSATNPPCRNLLAKHTHTPHAYFRKKFFKSIME